MDHSWAKTLVSIEDDKELLKFSRIVHKVWHLFHVLCSDWFYVGTSISPWIVTLEALEPFKCETIKQVIFNALKSCGEMLSVLL